MNAELITFHLLAVVPVLNSKYTYDYIYVSVQGCADLVTPEHAWTKRTGDVATVGCKHYKTWQLKCEASEWTGVVGSCNASS